MAAPAGGPLVWNAAHAPVTSSAAIRDTFSDWNEWPLLTCQARPPWAASGLEAHTFLIHTRMRVDKQSPRGWERRQNIQIQEEKNHQAGQETASTRATPETRALGYRR